MAKGQFVCDCGCREFQIHYLDKDYFVLTCAECGTVYNQCLDDFDGENWTMYPVSDDEGDE